MINFKNYYWTHITPLWSTLYICQNQVFDNDMNRKLVKKVDHLQVSVPGHVPRVTTLFPRTSRRPKILKSEKYTNKNIY